MTFIKKLKFTEEQKREYKKLKIIVGLVGVIGLIFTYIFYTLGYSDISYIGISITLTILIVYTYYRYRKILSKAKVTRAYADFQRQAYTIGLILVVPYLILLSYLVYLKMEFFAENLILLIILMFIPGIIAAILVALYEKKKFGALMRAP